jgi:hypothetical protein
VLTPQALPPGSAAFGVDPLPAPDEVDSVGEVAPAIYVAVYVAHVSLLEFMSLSDSRVATIITILVVLVIVAGGC